MRAIILPALMLSAGSLPAASVPAERLVTGNGQISVTINGAAGRLLVDPAGTAMPLVTAEYATRAGLKRGMLGFRYAVGPERVSGMTSVAGVDLGLGAAKRRVGWASRAATPVADGVIGPGGLPEPIVRFVLGVPRAGERAITLQMVDQGGIGSGWGERFGQITVGGLPMRVRFDPHHRRTLATAGAAARIAAAHGGTLSGDAVQTEIAFGIERPVRAMTLAQPLAVGPLSVVALGVRFADFGSAAAIREVDGDPDEVIVAGGKRDPNRDRLSIGADLLSRCSSLVYDKPAKLIRLTCA